MNQTEAQLEVFKKTGKLISKRTAHRYLNKSHKPYKKERVQGLSEEAKMKRASF